MVRFGILGCSDIAYRRFMPAAAGLPNVKVQAIAEEYAPGKLDFFCSEYGLEQEAGFEALLHRDDIDAIYVPQPPALHYKWAKRALECGKHVLVEKPSTTEYADSKALVELARQKGLALHENYMFQYHSQIAEIHRILSDGTIGDVRLVRTDFGFPLRSRNDFRYAKNLGGGALLDAGGYAFKLATLLLGDSVRAEAAQLSYMPGFEVDMYGSACLRNREGVVCQAGFGMDCQYRCSLDIWGSKGQLYTDRIYTSPPMHEPLLEIRTAKSSQTIRLKPDEHFAHSIEAFLLEMSDRDRRESMYLEILLQAKLVDEVRNLAQENGI